MEGDPQHLFHEDYYLFQVRTTGHTRPLDHYLEIGWKEARNPHPLIDARYYLSKNPDVAGETVSPLLHYVLHGAEEERDPHPLFDTVFYRQSLAEKGVLIPPGTNPLRFFLDTWADNLVDPHPLFNSEFYLLNNPDIADSGEIPLLHFLLSGVWEARSPHPVYPRTFMADDPAVRARKLNPFLIWLETREGSNEGGLLEFLQWRYDRDVEQWVLLDVRLNDGEPSQSTLEALAALVHKLAGQRVTSPDPEISIILPVHNQLHHTLGCLYSLLQSKTKHSFEVIVADDCSTDATKDLLPKLALGPIRYLRTARQLGFADNCTQAADKASGDYLVFLNNDTIVLPRWLDELIATFHYQADQGPVGMACSKLIYPDGRLQEAGGMIYREGTTANYGWGESAVAPAFNFVRDVDYGSGASVSIRRDLWESLAGFDGRYRPAYYEDTDLAMQVRQAGFRVLYNPHSVAVHFEGASHGRDITAGQKRFQRRNRDRFFLKWRRELAAFRPQPRRPYRDPVHEKRNTVLVIDACTPTPDRDSGSIDTLNYLKSLLKFGYRVIFVPQNCVYFGAYTRNLQSLGIECAYGPGKHSLQEAIGAYVREADIVLMFRHDVVRESLPTIRALAPAAKLIFEAVDLHHLREIRAAELSGDATAMDEALKTRELELAAMGTCDASIVLSQYEVDYLHREAPAIPLHHIPIARAEPALEPKAFAERKNILFIGGFQHPPNRDGLLWFHQEVWPGLLERGFQEDLVIVGGDMPKDIENLAGPQVRVLGQLPDVNDLFGSCRMSIAPLRYGAGLKGKVISSLSYGLPCVTTGIGAEGAPFEDHCDLLIADEPQDFQLAILSLMNDQLLWERLSQHGKLFFREHFSLQGFEKRLQDLLDEVCQPDLAARSATR